MDMAVPEETGQDPALEVEQCSCPPGYRGPSCQVSPGPHAGPASPSIVLPTPSPRALPTSPALAIQCPYPNGPCSEGPPTAIFLPPGL